MKSVVCALPALVSAQSVNTGTQVPGQEFGEGFISGFFGDESTFADCLSDVASMSQEFSSVVVDLKARNFSGAVGEVVGMFGDVQISLVECKAVGAAAQDILVALKDVRSVKDLLHRMKINILHWDDKMLDELERAAKVCTFQAPNAAECGRLIGTGARQLVIGDDPVSMLGHPRNKLAFVQGLLTALIGDTVDIKACAQGVSGFEGQVKKTLSDIKAHDVGAAIDDMTNMVANVSVVIRDCKGAAQDLAPYLHILDDVHSNGDLYQKIKRHALDNDVEVLDRIEDMFSSCTFVRPNARTCGEDMGTIVRLFVIGSSADVVV